MKKYLAIIGLKKVAGATKRIGVGEKGQVVFDKKTGKVEFEGVWRNDICIKRVVEDSDKLDFWVYKPMTMREILKMIMKEVDYDKYLEMDLVDEGIVIY